MEDLVLLAYQARVGSHGRPELVRVAQDRDRPAEEQALAAYLLHGLAPDRAWAAVIARVLNEKTIWFVFHAQFEPVTQAFGLSVAAKPQSPRAPRGHVAGPPRYMVEADVAPQRGRAARAVDFAPGTWRSPPCAGCAHQMHVWFTLRPAKIPELAWLTWPEAPLFTCGDCVFWTGVNRYKVQPKKKVITLVEAEHTGDKVLAKASANTKLARPQAAKLTKLTRASWEKVEEHHEPTVVAGKPPRLHDDSWPRCRDCKQWMRYYGALGTSPGFNRQGTIANDAGFLLHFACVPCSSITVVPNWS